MALLLVHRTLDGEPVGIWSESGESYYAPGFEDRQADGEAVVDAKGENVPWSTFVERKAASFNFQEVWGGYTSSKPLAAALEAVRDQYFTNQAKDIPVDRA